MKYLIDVNALIAWHHPAAEDHGAFHAWRKANAGSEMLSCGITELGFIRVSMQVFHYTAEQAEAALRHLRRHLRYATELPPPSMPAWATTAGRTTDAYLSQIASHHGASLATFDTQIPGSILVES
jgi:predicted nucleic acid-binding protein